MKNTKIEALKQLMDIKEYELKYIGLYGDKTTLTGDARQIVMHILNHI